ncbi:unnamed protein product [Allacma fusca]|uniref:Uncharacterized protein n=1 Tax=Allacma fusca TaxID=39272 RepID=A0A8J2PTC8_9HEXA|nr:unnamed protein product [Allacma fusca]
MKLGSALILLSVLLFLQVFHASAARAGTRSYAVDSCVSHCNGMYRYCVNQIAATGPEDQYAYTPCERDWDNCEEGCHDT